MLSRHLIGSSLAIFWILGAYLDLQIPLHLLMLIISAYDMIQTISVATKPKSLLVGLAVTVMIFNEISFLLYRIDKSLVIMIGVVTQVNDVLQYLTGTSAPHPHYIGWISPKKTYEGYIYGLLSTLLLLMFWYPISSIIIICLLGNLGGLLSSLVKRILRIKDYSQLLGSHGGWLDRIDSIILPTFYYFSQNKIKILKC